uniref:dihydroneopterin aldolase n=1 Tax=Elaeis guineensis var. tenera TaxID=51953 RepID=A0A8N4I752_ELAGV|nr:dihydroneopterin aldolase 2 isoform X2 [Elaeis guineensis]
MGIRTPFHQLKFLFHGFHGVKPEEKKLGQKFVVDVDAWLDLSEAGKSDNLSDTVSYTEIYSFRLPSIHKSVISALQEGMDTSNFMLSPYPDVMLVSHNSNRIVRDVVEGPSQNLLESVAHLIANTTLLKFPQISAVRVKVGKPHVAVHGTIDYLGVEILRYKKNEKPESL